jgi:hypothetical protein
MDDILDEQKRLMDEVHLFTYVSRYISHAKPFQGDVAALGFLLMLCDANYCIAMELAHGADMEAAIP